MRDSDAPGRAYKRLLAFYPKEFKERVGPSMEQTFADNLRERRVWGGSLIAFLAWTFAETSFGIMKERAFPKKKSIGLAAVAAFVLVLPLMILEWATRSDLPRSDFAFPLFVIMWLMAALFIITSIGVVRTVRAMRGGHVAALSSISLAARIGLMGLIAWTWATTVIDQWPCFLGATGC